MLGGASRVASAGASGSSAAPATNASVQMAAIANTGHEARYTSLQLAVKPSRMPRQRVAPRRKRIALPHSSGSSAAKPKNSSDAARSCPVCSASS